MHQSHVKTAQTLIANYKIGEPLHAHLKKFFRENKKFGSRDRKRVSALCYDYFRLGYSFKNVPEDEKIITGFYLCESFGSAGLEAINSTLNLAISKSLDDKLVSIGGSSEIEQIFPFKEELSKGIDHLLFCRSFLLQPLLFVRIRPGYEKKVAQKLDYHKIAFSKISAQCLCLQNASKIDTVLLLNKEAVVQDYNSQQTGGLMKKALLPTAGFTVWDCCAASGGKSIMAFDIDPAIRLTVSDKRPAILDNLKKRFNAAGITTYDSFITDLSKPAGKEGINIFPGFTGFDFIIADVPCTGSGTWSRTPEQLYHFNKNKIGDYSKLQKQIVENAVHHLKEGGYLLYITCSVFKQENEDVAAFIQSILGLKPLHTGLLKGYKIQADSMFAALFIKS